MNTVSETRVNSAIGGFIVKYAKDIITVLVFIGGLLLQHQANMMKIEQMESELASVKSQLDAQYVKLDNMKLDKAVFEATMRQFTDMQTDIRHIRDRLEDVLGDHQRHAPIRK